ncbi:sushi, von Willebrand factor type A, EGF and pentraxin domain-containing protein 1-like [Stegostoma tigrinum]|uniref:sushi, von Willebrand factor type A, EGF and pentraxin domain-containing protein 1-like n=1 Tax=Stegostoma tigrinum TaxID=3053191 RepID=UPI00286FE3DF|nr:sushi, von Willebrand factor type A, EGF and pentraxin domain-containing protein 1-like [Stegostoma tigrinum]
MKGRAYRQCTPEGWDGDVPSCEQLNCGNPGSIQNGYYKASKWTVGSNVTFHCDIGYKIIDRDYLQCTANGWDGEVPSCEAISCGNPGEILNGHFTTPNETFGNKVFFYCNFGYKIVGSAYRQCTAEGWDGDAPSCESITCGNPGEILHGYYNAPNKTVGSKVTFYCDVGYTMLGNSHRKCTTEGWDGEVPFCEPINCGNPGEILNGYYTASNGTFGNKVTFYCDVGYKMVGRDYQQCTAEGWLGDVPSCEPLNCGNPGSIPNGYYKAPNWTVGSNVTFYCDIGYKIIGRAYRQCTAEGWDGKVPSCEPITCGHPGDILNGHYEYLNETDANKVVFYCDFGYKMVGRAYQQCTAEGWVGDAPSCETIDCGNPGSILNGYYKASKWTVGNNVTFYCDIGYKMIGRDYRQCTVYGWDGKVPSCEQMTCGNPGKILNGHYMTSHGTVENKVFFYCDFGYKIVGRDYRQCTPEGWDGEVPSCEPITCGNPGEILHGYYNAPNKTVGSRVTFYCDVGYRMLGHHYRKCTPEGWDGEVPSCESINCGNPGEILNGYYTASNDTLGNKVTFYCNVGYKMVGRDYQQCTVEGWLGDVPTCEPINCGNPGSLLNGYYKAPNWTVGSNVTFYCDIGYKIIGRDYRQCTAEGWDGEIPSCEPISCGHPGEIPNGHYKASNETLGNKVTFYCDFGYKIVGRDYRQCTAEGWDGDVPSCEPINCGNPGSILNGYYKASKWTVGSNVTFYCDIGYKITGRDYRQCTADGWDGEAPSCDPITCGNPGEILNGYYMTPNETVGNKVFFYCDFGYKIVGSDYQQCTAEGWAGDVPSCEPITCGNPGTILNGYYNAPNKTVGNKATFYCDIGYTMLGKDYRKCTTEGWDGEVPSCESINCGDPGKIPNGYYRVPNDTVENKVTFYCDAGYKMVGRDYRQCTAEGWVGDVPSCEPINCGNPGSFPNGYYKAPNWTVGSNVTFYCDIGYKIIGRAYRQCTADGWDGKVPSCEPITCGKPGEILNGHYKAVNETLGNKVIFYCNFGYKMVGRAYQQCTAEGWDSDVPTCEPITCGNPGEMLNGYYSAPNKTFGNTVTFYCDIGYSMLGRDYRQCTTKGWDGEVPSCEPINCGNPGEILNGYYKLPNSTIGNKVMFYCNVGYKMVGRDYRQCTPKGWDGDVPSCEPINCGNPGSILNGYYKASEWTVGSNVTFYCDIGYQIIGRNYLQCTADGWEGKVPSCEPITCGNPGEILNGHYTTPNETVGNKVFFYCDFGYKIVGGGYRQCTADGWDGDVPSCEPITCGYPGEILNGYYNAPNKIVGNNVTFYCDIGYAMLGRDYRKCTPEGWDGDVPSCEPINCGNPDNILNGYYVAPNVTAGNKVTFYCNAGYKLVGRDYQQCTAGGWDGDVPSCEPQSALVGMTTGINMGVIAVLGLIFCVVCFYRKRFSSNKGEYYLASSVPMSLPDNQMSHSESCNRPV